MSENEVLYSVDGSVATITINRPKKYNALNTFVVEELRKAMNKAEDDDTVRVIILTGSGEKAFAAGADINEFRDKDSETVRPLAEAGQSLCTEIESMTKPVIACVNGFALGGGCEIAMACDIRYASTNARFGQPEINLGIIPGFGGTVRLPRLIGLGMAKELVFSGEQIIAEEAKDLGLINEVFESVEKLREETNALAQDLSKKPGVAIKLAKKSMNAAWALPVAKNLELEVDLFTEVFDTEDKEEGVDAFLSKREPDFSHK